MRHLERCLQIRSSFSGTCQCPFSYASCTVLDLRSSHYNIALQFLKIDLYGAEMTLIALMPILNGFGTLVDSYVSAFGSAYTCQIMGVRHDSSYRDII